eukprot:GFYU01000570.1.p1 GENE.GFYU01000570.1~~GFYU01000570.1.p1  ORF type:complete len:439 (+),score=121.03 GFYU01000570.1:206-1522(+)
MLRTTVTLACLLGLVGTGLGLEEEKTTIDVVKTEIESADNLQLYDEDVEDDTDDFVEPTVVEIPVVSLEDLDESLRDEDGLDAVVVYYGGEECGACNKALEFVTVALDNTLSSPAGSKRNVRYFQVDCTETVERRNECSDLYGVRGLPAISVHHPKRTDCELFADQHPVLRYDNVFETQPLQDFLSHALWPRTKEFETSEDNEEEQTIPVGSLVFAYGDESDDGMNISRDCAALLLMRLDSDVPVFHMADSSEGALLTSVTYIGRHGVSYPVLLSDSVQDACLSSNSPDGSCIAAFLSRIDTLKRGHVTRIDKFNPRGGDVFHNPVPVLMALLDPSEDRHNEIAALLEDIARDVSHSVQTVIVNKRDFPIYASIFAHPEANERPAELIIVRGQEQHKAVYLPDGSDATVKDDVLAFVREYLEEKLEPEATSTVPLHYA